MRIEPAADRQSPSGRLPHEASVRYEITVRGTLDSHWSAWFEGMAVTSDEHRQTVIAGSVPDQAALHGLLAKIRDLGLPLISVRVVGSDQCSDH